MLLGYFYASLPKSAMKKRDGVCSFFPHATCETKQRIHIKFYTVKL